MAHYAFIDENNIVIEVIVGKEETELLDGLDPETWYGNFRGLTCKRTSYNTAGNVHMTGGTPYRFNYAGIGYTFDSTKGIDGAFIPPQPYPSWSLNEDTCVWQAPIEISDHSKLWDWDESSLSWTEKSI
jgi:hypothetical protein